MSKVLIAFASKHGCTEECAKALSGKMNTEVDLCNLKEKKQIDLNAYDKIILGGSIYAGRIQREVKEFCSKNESRLKEKKLGLYICGMSQGDEGNKQLMTAYPQSLLDASLVKENFGAKIEINKMNFMEKKLIKIVAKVESDFSNISESVLDQFAQVINEV